MTKRKLSLMAVCFLLFLSGCTVGGKQVFFSIVNPFTVFSIGPLSCGTKEAKVYLANYKNIYGMVGETDLWSEEFYTSDIEDGIKRSAIYHLSRVYSLDLYARERGMELDDAESEKIEVAAKEYYDSLSEKERKAIGVRLRDIHKMYEHYALAEKVYFEVMKSVDEEISEDEARIMDAYVLFTKNKKQIPKIEKQLKEGVKFEDLVAAFSSGEKSEISFGRNTYPAEVEEEAFSLDDGEISDRIDTKDCSYWIMCVDKYNEKLSEENKNKIIETRKRNVFQKIIDEQSEKYYSRINTALLEKIHFEFDSSIRTDSFFSTIEEQISFQ
ncbi:MAG: peptidylprolyl isomerase [Lachnospiraceae bacterium]|nr:peptidylprolyl isomerase [Lachnospiraceae bacterium]